MKSETRAALGVDLSDRVGRLVVVNGEGRVLSRGEFARDGAKVARLIRDGIKRAASKANATVGAVGLALPNPGDEAPSDLFSVIADAVPGAGAPTVVAAGHASALAEHWCGVAVGAQTVVSFSLGEHVTAGVVVNGKPWTGASGLAGSIGWLAVNPVEREDYRRLGSLEAEVAAAGIVRRVLWRVKSGDSSTLFDQKDIDATQISAAQVFAEARKGDGICVSVARDTARYAGMAVANLITILDPDVVVLGGMIVTAHDILFEPIRSECARRVHPRPVERLRILLSSLGDDAVAIGAAGAALRAQP